jgi:pectate lyase
VTPAAWRCSLLLGAAFGLGACGDGSLVRLGGELSNDGGAGGSGLPEAGAPDGSEGDASLCATGQPVSPLLELLDERVGYGDGVTGGRDGCMYVVENERDDGLPGSLRYGLELPDPLWIVFDQDVISITLERDIVPMSNKTIDGRGRHVTIRNHGLDIANVQNLIIVGLEFVGQLDDSDDHLKDAITIGQGAHTIWIDHCSFSSYEDGLIDVINGATDITISWSHFFDHDKAMLFGNDIDDIAAQNMRVTLHHNWFDGTYTYNPRIRFGQVHMFNNLLDSWGDYGVAASHRSKLLSEGNIYRADDRTDNAGSKEAIIIQAGDNDEPGNARSEGDLALNGAVLLENNRLDVVTPSYEYSAQKFEADAGAGDGGIIPLMDLILREAGVDRRP